MSAVADLMRELINRGMDAAEAAALVARAGAEIATPRRSKGAVRTARWRENRASQNVTERHTDGDSQEPSHTSLSVTERHKTSQRDDAHISNLSTSSQNEQSQKEVRKSEGSQRKRASRLAPDWQPSEANIAFAIERGITRERLSTVVEKFRNHWTSKSGSSATKLDWDATWRTWCINEIEWNGGPNGPRPNHPARRSGADDFFAGLASVAADIDRDRAVARPADADIPRGRFEFDAEPTRRN